MMTRLVLTIGCMALLLGGAGSAQASMELTSGAQTDGFQLSTFASDFPSFLAGEGQNGGPFGIAFAGNGTVLVEYLNGHIYVFPSDANNQTVSGATVGATDNSYDPLGMTQTGGKIYVGFQTSSVIDQVSSTGTFVSTLASIPQPHGIVCDPDQRRPPCLFGQRIFQRRRHIGGKPSFRRRDAYLLRREL